MKKLITLVIAIVLAICSFSLIACGNNGTNKVVNVKYYNSATDIIPLMTKQDSANSLNIALLPEPACTNLSKLASDKTWYRLSLQELYDSETKSYPQAVLMIKESLLKSYPNIVSYIESTFDSNMNWVKENTATAVNMVNSKLASGVTPSLKAPVITSQVVDNCNIYWQKTADAKAEVKTYINQIIDLNSESAKSVEDDFFYNGSVTTDKTFSKDKITVVCPDGAPALALAKYINDNDNFESGKQVEYNIVSSDTLGQNIVKDIADIIIMPVNAASKLYKANKTAENYKMVSVLTHGNLYIMSDTEIKVEDLANKTMGVIGQGLVPDLTLQVVLNKYKIKVEIAD